MTATLHYKAEPTFFTILQTTDNNYFVQIDTDKVYRIIMYVSLTFGTTFNMLNRNLLQLNLPPPRFFIEHFLQGLTGVDDPGHW